MPTTFTEPKRISPQSTDAVQPIFQQLLVNQRSEQPACSANEIRLSVKELS